MKHKFLAEDNGTVFDLVSRRFSGVPAAVVKRQIKLGEVRVAGLRVRPDTEVEAGEEVTVFLPKKWEAPAPCELVYVDDRIVVVDKPALTEVETHLAAALSEAYGEVYPVHRLDRNTTGLVVFARSRAAEAALLAAFGNRQVDKYYLAEVFGRPRKEEDTLTAYLYKDAARGYCRVSDRPEEGWQKIVTAYRVLSAGRETSLLSVRLMTGRTHQIRAHLAHIGCPVVGDRKYGDPAQAERYQRLRAVRLVFGKLDPPLGYLSGKSIEAPEKPFGSAENCAKTPSDKKDPGAR